MCKPLSFSLCACASGSSEWRCLTKNVPPDWAQLRFLPWTNLKASCSMRIPASSLLLYYTVTLVHPQPGKELWWHHSCFPRRCRRWMNLTVISSRKHQCSISPTTQPTCLLARYFIERYREQSAPRLIASRRRSPRPNVSMPQIKLWYINSRPRRRNQQS